MWPGASEIRCWGYSSRFCFLSSRNMTMAANLLQVHARVILTPTATDCVHALFGVYTKYIKQGGVSFSFENDSSPVTLTSNTHTKAQNCCLSGLLPSLCVAVNGTGQNTVWPRVVPEEPPTVWEITVCLLKHYPLNKCLLFTSFVW